MSHVVLWRGGAVEARHGDAKRRTAALSRAKPRRGIEQRERNNHAKRRVATPRRAKPSKVPVGERTEGMKQPRAAEPGLACRAGLGESRRSRQGLARELKLDVICTT